METPYVIMSVTSSQEILKITGQCEGPGERTLRASNSNEDAQLRRENPACIPVTLLSATSLQTL